ncbi:MAG TPA: SDR family oxidoreductase [Acidobacteriota bacterium]|nr:SDR family oxidoreductase [Acidobacteriota bacterium]
MSKCLVTGGAGFIGSHLVQLLLNLGHSVRILDNFETGSRETISKLKGEVEVIEGSVVDLKTVQQAVHGMDWVFHQAARGSVPRSIEDPAGTHEINITGTLNVLIASRDSNVNRVICASSSSIYGEMPELPKREDMLPSPESPYAISKITLEYYCRVFYQAYGLETVSLRYFNIYGPRQNPLLQYAAVIPIFIRNMLEKKQCIVYGDGEQTRDFAFVEDCAEANLLAATSASAVGNVYNIGCGKQISVNQLFVLIQKLTGDTTPPKYEPRRKGDVMHSCADISRAKTALNFKPKFDLDKGLQITTDWYRKNNK